mmetsp:Transcript_149025/g.415304  ORF Transcript_149025/g.415304 Transcript_149025/m.415304 type:complete len:224 (-) Transcript_149025:385-1056(-)
MRSTTWKRGAKETSEPLAFVACNACCTNRPSSRSPSKSVGSSGRPALSRFKMRLICTTRGRRLNNCLALSLFSCRSTSLMEGGLPAVAAFTSPRSSTSSRFSFSISGSVSMIFSLTSTTPDGRPMARRSSMTSFRRSTASCRDMRSSNTSPAAPPFFRRSMVSTEKVQRVCSATSMVKASAPQRMKCQYFLELKESTKMLPATSLSIRRALSKPSEMGMKRGT